MWMGMCPSRTSWHLSNLFKINPEPGIIERNKHICEVGRLFKNGEFYVPEMLISTRAMKGGLAILRAELTAVTIEAIGKVMIGGAPVTEQYPMYVGADIYAPDAASAAQRARQLMQG
jgi:methanogenic corrinoid protein MtbC1